MPLKHVSRDAEGAGSLLQSSLGPEEKPFTLTALSTSMPWLSGKLLIRPWATGGFLLEVIMGGAGGWPSLLCPDKDGTNSQSSIVGTRSLETFYPMPPGKNCHSPTCKWCSRGLHGPDEVLNHPTKSPDNSDGQKEVRSMSQVPPHHASGTGSLLASL